MAALPKLLAGMRKQGQQRWDAGTHGPFNNPPPCSLPNLPSHARPPTRVDGLDGAGAIGRVDLIPVEDGLQPLKPSDHLRARAGAVGEQKGGKK